MYVNLFYLYRNIFNIIFVIDIYTQDAISQVPQGPSQQELDKYKSLLDKAVPKMKELQVHYIPYFKLVLIY